MEVRQRAVGGSVIFSSTGNRLGLLSFALIANANLIGCSGDPNANASEQPGEPASLEGQAPSVPSDGIRIVPVVDTGGQIVPSEPEVKVTAASSELWAFWALLSSILAIASVSLSAYLLFWRRKLPDGQVSVLPEVVVQAMEKLVRQNLESLKTARADRADTQEQLRQIQSSFTIFSELAGQKDAQIDRLQRGSDKQVYRQFLKRFVRVLNMVDDDISEDQAAGKDTHAIESLRSYLFEALEDSGLEEYSPPLGEDYRTAVGVADRPKAIPTNDLALDWTISSVPRCGYVMNTGQDPLIVAPAIVEIFRYQKAGD